MHKRLGFTLPEILLVLGIVAILAAVLLPILINPRAKAYDVAAQACLREVAAQQLAYAAQAPFQYNPALVPSSVAACSEVGFTAHSSVTVENFVYEAKHNRSAGVFQISAAGGLVKVN